MNFKKSMISIAAASILAVGFTGCGDSDDVVNDTNEATLINTPKGTVTGLVQDTNGNPLNGVKVYLADRETTTTAGGLYTFMDVPVSNTSGMDAATANNVISVTIAAPEGYLGATVTVTPSAQIDSAESTTNTASGTETFVDGYLAQAGTAVLPALNATVTGKLENIAGETPIVNQEITLDFINVTTSAGANVAQPQDGVITTYATGNYTATTDANGKFTISGVPADSDLNYVVGNFTVIGEERPQGTNATTVTTNDEVAVVNVADIQVAAIANEDNAAPFVKSVTGVINNNMAAIPAMLEDDVRNTFVVNFSEAMDIEIDEDLTHSVIVKTGATRVTMTDIDATATLGTDGKSVIVTVPADLADATLLDINLLVTDFKDKAGNYLKLNVGTTTPANNDADTSEINYDTNAVNTGNTQVVALQLQIFNDLNTNAKSVTDLAQKTIDTNGAANDAALLQAENSAFLDVVDSGNPDNVISQMNSADDDNNDNVSDVGARLTTLGSAATGTAVTMITDVPRITFTPNTDAPAAAYQISVTRNGAVVDLNNGITVQGGNSVATVVANDIDNADLDGDATTGTKENIVITPTNSSSIESIEFTIATATVQVGDILTITPLDDLGYAGSSTPYTLADNVAPTTILQRSYGLGNSTNANNTVVKFGDGGELADTAGDITVGTPYLVITAGLLDNLNASGAAVTGIVASDNKLTKELYGKNAVNTTTNKAYIAEAKGIYDTSAWAAFNTDASLTRTMGVSFSEDVALIEGKTPATTNVTATLSDWKNNSDVVINDDNGAVNVDLIDVKVDNIMTLANYDGQRRGIIDFTDTIVDNANNIADTEANAKVVVYDKMPPFVTQAYFDGTDVVITFNEALRTMVSGDTVTIENNTGIARTANYAVANAAKYVLSNNNMTLSVDATEFTGLTANDFDIGIDSKGKGYAEAVYNDANATNHAALSWTVADTYGNEWTNESAGVTAPKFAIMSMIGDFIINEVDDTNFRVGDNSNTTTQSIVWKFSHPLVIDINGGSATNTPFDKDIDADGYDSTTEIFTLDSTSLSTIWSGANGLSYTLFTGTANLATLTNSAFNAAGSELNNTSTTMSLSADRKTVTLNFKTNTSASIVENDKISFKSTSKSQAAFTSAYTGNEKLEIAGTAQKQN